VNNILLFTLWYFVNVLGGTQKRISKVTRLLKNYLWVGTSQNSKRQMAWDHCCEKMKFGGLMLVDLNEAKNALPMKCIMNAFELVIIL